MGTYIFELFIAGNFIIMTFKEKRCIHIRQKMKFIFVVVLISFNGNFLMMTYFFQLEDELSKMNAILAFFFLIQIKEAYIKQNFVEWGLQFKMK